MGKVRINDLNSFLHTLPIFQRTIIEEYINANHKTGYDIDIYNVEASEIDSLECTWLYIIIDDDMLRIETNDDYLWLDKYSLEEITSDDLDKTIIGHGVMKHKVLELLTNNNLSKIDWEKLVKDIVKVCQIDLVEPAVVYYKDELNILED